MYTCDRKNDVRNMVTVTVTEKQRWKCLSMVVLLRSIVLKTLKRRSISSCAFPFPDPDLASGINMHIVSTPWTLSILIFPQDSNPIFSYKGKSKY